MMKKIGFGVLFVVLVVVALLLFSNAMRGSSKEIHLLIGPQLVDCLGGGMIQGKCYQAKSSASEPDWGNFSDAIEGFEWEPGYEYELRVEVTDYRPINYDNTFRSFVLIEVVSKTKVE